MKQMLSRLSTVFMAVVLALSSAVAQKSDQGEVQLKAAIKKETVDGDLKGAIEQYGTIVAKYKTDRAVAAMALVHMAECYRKMGDAESRKIYERVLRDYADQKEAVALARAHLGGGNAQPRQTSTLVWSSPKADDEGTGTISPDGRYISYVDWDTGDLALHEIGTGVDRRLTNKGSWKDSDDFAEESAISKDGKQIAYTWYKGKENRAELRIANLAGDLNPRTLYDNLDVEWISVYDWAPDGKSVAVKVRRKDRTAQIGLVSLPEGSLRVLKTIDWRGAGRIFFSPHGNDLGYDLPESDTSRERDVFVLSIDGTREIRAVTHRGNEVIMGWSADGKWLLFASDRTGSMGLWGLRFGDGKPQGTPELLRSDLPARVEPLGLTRSGALYYGTPGQERSTIQVASFDFPTGRFLSAPSDITQDYSESNWSPAWSPDGSHLAYLARRGPARNPDLILAIRSMETGQVRELHPKLIYFNIARWAPDGRSFLTEGKDIQGRRGIFRIDADTGNVSLLIADQEGERAMYPAWSPDGKSVYFPRDYFRTKDRAFIQWDLATGKEREVIRRHYLGGANVSPDGRYIATVSADPATNSRMVLLIPLAGGEPGEMMRVASDAPTDKLWNANAGVFLSNLSWARDSRSLLAWKTWGTAGDRKGELWQIPIDGGEPRKVDAKLIFSTASFNVHPDGRRLAFEISEPAQPGNGAIWALENFLPTLSAKK